MATTNGTIQNGGSGDDVVNGTTGNDRFSGGSGSDTLNGGAGSDILKGDSGDDILVYRLSENSGATDVYTGGSGIDVVCVLLTEFEWLTASVQYQLGRYYQHLQTVRTNANSGEVSNGSASDFTFNFGGGTTLTVQMTERLEVVVDGVPVGNLDRPAIDSGTTLGAVVEDGNADANPATSQSATGTIQFFDLDFTDDHVVSLPGVAGVFGVFSANVTNAAFGDGQGTVAWTYNLNNAAVQFLAAGESRTENFTVRIADADNAANYVESPVAITITGTNDAVTITSGAQSGIVVEDAPATPDPLDAPSAGGMISFKDIDLSDAHEASVAKMGGSTNLGAFALGSVHEEATTEPGSVMWTYTLNNEATQYLAAGESVTETYAVTLDDQHGSTSIQDVAITITGTNDVPAISVGGNDSDAKTLAEANTTLATAGTLTAVDVDLTDALSPSVVSVVASGATAGIGSHLGTAAFDFESGTFGDFQVTGNVTIQTIGGDHYARLATGPLPTTTLRTATFSVPADGKFEFDFLNQAGVAPVQVVLQDVSNNATFDVYRAGGPDANPLLPSVLSGPDARGFSHLEADLSSLSGRQFQAYFNLLNFGPGTFSIDNIALPGTQNQSVNDALQEMLTVGPATIAADPGAANNLNWSFNAEAEAFDYLALGESLTLTYTVRATDNSGATADKPVTITITGTNDSPVITSAAGANQGVAANENTGDLTSSGTIAFSDVDLTNTHSVSAVLVSATDSATHGAAAARGNFVPTISIASTGDGNGFITWHFSVAASALDDLAEGQAITQVYTVKVTDSAGASDEQAVTLTLTGTNDVPVIVNHAPTAVALSTTSLDEGTPGALVGLISVTDPDPGETFNVIVDDVRFEVLGNQLKLRDDVSIDFEALLSSQLDVRVTAVDSGSLSVSQVFSLTVNNGTEGAAIDGYISGATVFRDMNLNSIHDNDEVSAVTDATGNFLIFGNGPLGMTGGTDIATNLAFPGGLRAPSGATVITPLTTLVSFVMEAGPSEISANALALQSLQLAPMIVLKTFDQIASTLSVDPTQANSGKAAACASAKLHDTVLQAASLLQGTSDGNISLDAAIKAVYATLAAQVIAGTLNLNGTGAVENLLRDAAARLDSANPDSIDINAINQMASGAASVIVAGNDVISAALSTGQSGVTLLETLAKACIVAQDAADALRTAGADGTSAAANIVVAGFTGTALTQAFAAAASEVGNVIGIQTASGTNGPDFINGGIGNDIIYGFGGFDTINGNQGHDTLYGGDDGDFLNGGVGNDVIYGEGGNDNVSGGDGNDTLYGGTGDDWLEQGSGFGLIDGGAGNDRISGGFGGFGGFGAVGSNVLLGGEGNDRIQNIKAGDIVDGGAGDDTIEITSLSSVTPLTLTLGEGRETVELRTFFASGAPPLPGQPMPAPAPGLILTDFDAAGGEVLDLSALLGAGPMGQLQGWDGATNPFSTGPGGGFLRLQQQGADVIFGIDSNGGGDNYMPLVQFSNLSVSAFTAANLLPGYDPAGGAVPGQTINGTPGPDLLSGGEGNDTISGFGGFDTLNGNGGDDTLYGGDDGDFLNGGVGNDVIYGEGGNDNVSGGDGNDTLYGGTGDDWLEQGSGFGLIDGGAGNDRISGGFGGFGGFGAVGSNVLLGGEGNDRIQNIKAGDIVDGGAGDDTIEITSLSSVTPLTLTLGEGRETVELRTFFASGAPPLPGQPMPAPAPGLILTDFDAAGGEVLDLSALLGAGPMGQLQGWDGATNPFSTGPGGGFLRLQQQGADVIFGIDSNGGGDNYMPLVQFSNLSVSAFTAANLLPGYDPAGGAVPGQTINGTPGPDLLSGGEGNDTISGFGGFDTLNGNGGDDTLYGGDDGDFLNGGVGNDVIYGEGGNDNVSGGDGNDTLYGGTGDDWLEQGSGFGLIDGGAGNDRISGGFGGFGAVGSNVLLGGEGNDRIQNIKAGDIVDGGAGDDTIEITSLSSVTPLTLTLGEGRETVELRTFFASGAPPLPGQPMPAPAPGLILTDFDAAGGEVLDLSALLGAGPMGQLQGWDGATNPFSTGPGGGFLRLQQQGADVIFGIDSNGGGDNYMPLVQFSNLSVSAFTAANLLPGYDPYPI